MNEEKPSIIETDGEELNEKYTELQEEEILGKGGFLNLSNEDAEWGSDVRLTGKIRGQDILIIKRKHKNPFPRVEFMAEKDHVSVGPVIAKEMFKKYEQFAK